MPTPSMPKAMNIVFSRPIMSEIQPKNGRVRPLSTRSIVAANVTAVIVMPISVTEIEEGALKARVLDHRLDRRDRQRRACAKSGGGDAGSEAALVGKPFQRIT